MKVKGKFCMLFSFIILLIICSLQSNYTGYSMFGSLFGNREAFITTTDKSVVTMNKTGTRKSEAVSNRKSHRIEKPLTQYGGHLMKNTDRDSHVKRTGRREDVKDVDKLTRNTSIPKLHTADVVYDVDILLNELKKLHDTLYTKAKNDTCKIRPAGCVIIGIAKSGTQELLNFLSIHPNVVQKHDLPNPNLFDKDSHIDRRKEKMPCTYSDQIGIVKTDYFFFRENMPAKFYEFNKKLKMILLVREPVERMISAYSFSYLQQKQHKLVFNYRLEDIPDIDSVFVDPKNASVKTSQIDLTHSVYDSAMERYLKYFSKDQILVLEATEFKTDPVTVLQRVEKFLGIRPVITSDYFTYNQSKHFHCLKTMKRTVCYGSDRGRAKLKEIKPETRQKLREYFKPHNERFFEMIGKRFAWP